jgi:replicative DNA helicase Mcm
LLKDDFIGWTFAAGTLVLAHKNVAIIDEFDKMSKEDRDQIHEALEQQTVTLSKANIQAKLSCECSLLAGANPKYGRFDPYSKTIAEQIELPPTIINRFELIFPVRDIPEPAKDEKLARMVLSLHKDKDKSTAEIDTPLLRKYLNLAKSIIPSITDDAIERIVEYYLKIRGSGDPDKKVKPIPISARQLEGMVRLSEAYAKLRLSKMVTVNDAKNAIEMLDHCLKEVAFDKETGTVDIDRIATGIGASQRNKILDIKLLISELENEIGKNIPIEDIIERAAHLEIAEETVEDCIEKLKKKGDIFEPRKGFISRI